METTNPLSTLPDFASAFRLNDRITTLEKEVVELKKDPLHTQVTTLVDEHLDTRLGETREEFMKFLSESLTTRIKEQLKDQLPRILPKEVSNFAPLVIEKLIKESRDEVTLIKVSYQEGNSSDNDDEPRKEDASKRDWFKKPTPPQEPTNPDWYEGKTPQKGPTQNWLMTLATSTSIDKSLKDFDELMSTPIDFSGYILNGLKIKNLTQEIMLGPAFRLLKGTQSDYAELEYDFEECYKALSEKLDWENPEGDYYPFDLSKPLPLIKRRKRQRVPIKVAQYDLPGIEDMVPNIWSPVKVAYDKYALWGISHWREQRKSFYAFVRGMQSRGDVYSTRRILAVTHVKINDIEDMSILMVQNWLTNLLGDDVADFVIALRMFTRSLVIQKRVEDLQLGVKSYQKQINVTKPDTRRLDLRKRPPYTSYKDPQGFIYVNDFKRNSYKVVRHRYSNPMIQPGPEGSTQGYPLVSVEVLRFDTSAGNPVKEILLKLNLPDHRIFKYGGEDGEMRLCLVDDLKVLKITFSLSSQDKATSSHLKSMITTSNQKLMIEVKDYKLKTEVKA
ncbi:hypothetical protein Tco_0137638 [Tanacetum coccineum]